MKYYIIAGEASGDLHGSNLMKALRSKDEQADFRCWGGDLMASQGGVLVKHYKELAFMGFVEVALNLKTILSNIKLCKKDILNYKPDAVILIDYPGFNLRIANFAHQEKIKVIYYISPQVWAWKKSRVFTIRKVVDKMLVILPFERDFYARYHVGVDYVGHPLLDVIGTPSHERTTGAEKPVIALLPGSRKQEIERVLPLMTSVIPDFPGCSFVIAAAPGIEPDFYKRYLGDWQVEILFGQTYKLLSKADAALVTSGTASLETALFEVPQVICYKGSSLSFAIARRIVKVDFIGLPNLIMGKAIVTELIQHELTTPKLVNELKGILYDRDKRESMQKSYGELRLLLGGAGASLRAAEKIVDFMRTSHV